MTELISINEAMRRGLTKLRLDKWSNPQDHIELQKLDAGNYGPWVKLWSPTAAVCGYPNPQKLIITMLGDLDDPSWRPFGVR